MQHRRAILLLLLVLLLQSGCSNRVELNDVAIISATGVDWHDGSWAVTYQVITPRMGSQTAAVDMYSAQGDSFRTALSKAHQEASRRLYYSNNTSVIIGKEAARKGLSPLLETYMNEYELRETANIYLTKGSARSVMEQFSGRNKDISGTAMQRLNASEEAGLSSVYPMTVHQVLTDLLGKTQTSGIPGLHAANETGSKGKPAAPAKIRLSETGLIVEDRLVGWLTDKQSQGVMWLSGRGEKTMVAFACPEDGEEEKRSAVHLIHTKTKQRPEWSAGKWLIHIDVEAKGNLSAYHCSGDWTNPAQMKAVEDAVALEVKAIMLDGWHAVRRYKADVVGFGPTIHQKYPKQWKSAEEDWKRLFPQTEVIMNVKMSLKSAGMSKTNFNITGQEVSRL